MSDRLAEIRARLDAWREVRYPQPSTAVMVDDVAWLLERVQEQDEHLRAISQDLADANSG